MANHQTIPHHVFAYLTLTQATQGLAEVTRWCEATNREIEMTFDKDHVTITSPNRTLHIDGYPVVEMYPGIGKGAFLRVYQSMVVPLLKHKLNIEPLFEEPRTDMRG